MEYTVLTVKQPWASLICSGIKDIENRTWKLPEKYKGKRILIHSSIKPDRIKFEIQGQATSKEITICSALNEAEENNLFGCIIGSVEVIDCVVNHPSIWAKQTVFVDRCFRDPAVHNNKEWKVDIAGNLFSKKDIIYNWMLANPILFEEPIPVKGKLSLWKYETDKILK